MRPSRCSIFGLFIFFLLYNLYLLQLGFREDFLGLVASAMTGGSIAGSLLAALAIRRFGLRNTLAGCFVSVACIAALRSLRDSCAGSARTCLRRWDTSPQRGPSAFRRQSRN